MKLASTVPIKGIFFDAGDTLFEAKESIGVSYSRFAAIHGVQQDPEMLDRRFKTVFSKSPPLVFPGKADQDRRTLEFNWWCGVARSVFEDIHFADFALFFEDLYQYYEQGAAWQLFPETLQVLSDLRMKHYFLGIISNFDSRLPAICTLLGIQDYFDDILYSSREGFAKPAPEIFEIALKQAGLAPSETIHVGDSIEHDMEGAEKVGMLPVLLDRGSAASEPYSGRRITTLSGIFQYL